MVTNELCVCVSMQLHTHRPSANLSSWSRVHVCQPHFFLFFFLFFSKVIICASVTVIVHRLLFGNDCCCSWENLHISLNIRFCCCTKLTWIECEFCFLFGPTDFVKFPLSLHLFTLRVHNSGSYRNNNETNTTCNFSNWFWRSIEYLSI